MSYVAAVSTKDVVSVNRHVVAQLLNHSLKLIVTFEVSVAPVQSLIVDSFQLTPNRFLNIEGRAIRRHPSWMKAAQFFLYLRRTVCAVVIHN